VFDVQEEDEGEEDLISARATVTAVVTAIDSTAGSVPWSLSGAKRIARITFSDDVQDPYFTFLNRSPMSMLYRKRLYLTTAFVPGHAFRFVSPLFTFLFFIFCFQRRAPQTVLLLLMCVSADVPHPLTAAHWALAQLTRGVPDA